tara:strand:+ start:300 stop:476 length:177 start_codon:yes stop_codon:yes gene_type:complete
MNKNTRLSDASEFAENFVASVLLQQLLSEAEQLPIVERLINLEHIATLIMASQSPAEA